jgi:hypothetical protein
VWAFIAVLRWPEAVNNFPRANQIQLFTRDFFEIRIVVSQPGDALAQDFVFLLQPLVLLVQLDLLRPQAPQMKRAAFADDAVGSEQED